MIDVVLLILGIGYAVSIIGMAVIAFAVRYSQNTAYRPRVSVIVAARNEEANIGRCLDSFTRLTYPRELLDVIVINDRSTDATPAIISEFAGRHPFIRLLNAAPGEGHLVGKTNAVTQGIEASTGEVLFMTDADCSVPPGWIEQAVKYYTSPSIGLVPGFTDIRHRNMFEAMQAMDWFALFTVASATTAIRFPVTAVGTNFTVRRAAYEATGGYRKIPFSVTEDYALFHAVTGSTDFTARYPMDPGTLVQSEPCPTWADLFKQRKRWFSGGKGMDAKSILIFAWAWFLNLLIIVGLIAGWPGAVTALILKAGADFVLTLPAVARFRRWEILPAFPLYELYFYFYVFLLPPIVLTGSKVVWKDRVHS